MRQSLNFLIIILLMTALSAEGQKLAIRDFEARPQDLDAQSNTLEKRDRNGKRAAIIKIFTSLPSSELTFGGSGQGFVGQEQHGLGQVWLYVPRASQKVTISHPKYDPLTFFYPTDIMEGRVYSMILSPEGKEVSLSASARNAEIWIDGDSIGVSPLNIYIPFGTHAVRAKLGSLLFDDDIVVERDGPTQFMLKMEDENIKYGDLVVDVDGGAELWFQGRREGIGRFTAHLREGDYIIEARKADHENATTTFHVTPGQVTRIKANSPTPHLGYLKLVTVPEHGITVTQADTLVAINTEMQLPVANYEWKFSRRGYKPVTRRFHISRGETLSDTVVLKKIQYVPRTTAYASAAGINIGGGIALGDYKDYSSIPIGVKYQYRVTDAIRLEAVFNYGIGISKDFGDGIKGMMDALTYGINAHYIVNPESAFKFYPIVGIGGGTVKAKASSDNTSYSESKSGFMYNVGVGGEYPLTENIALGLEIKFQSIINDVSYNRIPIELGATYKF